MSAALKLPAGEGLAKFKHRAMWLKREHPRVAASLLEGLEELFTVNALGLGLTASLMRCLASTSVIENPNGRLRNRARHRLPRNGYVTSCTTQRSPSTHRLPSAWR